MADAGTTRQSAPTSLLSNVRVVLFLFAFYAGCTSDTGGKLLYSPALSLVRLSAGKQADTYVRINVHRTTGDDSAEDIYVSDKLRPDFLNLRFQNAGNGSYLDYQVERIAAGVATCRVNISRIPPGLDPVYIRAVYGGRYAPDIKLALTADTHYTLRGPSPGSGDALTYIRNFRKHMFAYGPDLVLHTGDDQYSAGNREKAILWLKEVQSQYVEVPGFLYQGVGPGNHDFEFLSLSDYTNIYRNEWYEAGTAYGSYDVDLDGDRVKDIHIISLDACYDDDATHWDKKNNGGTWPGGYLPASELRWLERDLRNTTLPAIVVTHQSIGEFEQAGRPVKYSDYHVLNRAAVREILERSGNVIAVLGGHQHWFKTASIHGIPYIQIPSLTYAGALGTKVSNIRVGGWLTLEVSFREKALNVRYWEQDSVTDVMESYRHLLYYSGKNKEMAKGIWVRFPETKHSNSGVIRGQKG